MTDDELISKILHMVKQANYLPNVFGNDHVEVVAAYCMGVCATDPYANFYDDYKPWNPVFQVTRVMGLFDSSPTALSLTLAMYTVARCSFTHIQQDNFYRGLKPLLSDYTARKMDQINDNIPSAISRTYNVVLHIVQLAKVLNVLTSGNQSMPVAQVVMQVRHARETLVPFCNIDVDAHPLAKTTLIELIEQVEAKL